MAKGDRQSITAALRTSDLFTQITTITGALEDLAPTGIKRRSSYLSYRIARLRYPRILRGPVSDAVFSPRVEKAVSVGKLAASVVLLVVDAKSPTARAMRIVQMVGHIYGHVRVGGYGQDGSDHALSILHASQMVASFSKPGSAAERAAFEFVAAQGILSYFASGIVKLISPVWRAGAAMQGITRATSYGDERLHIFMQRYPTVAKLVAWGTIIGETVSPLVLIMPSPLRAAWQGSMVSMHAGIARFMGLNRFFWAFTAFHPVIALTAARSFERLRRGNHRKRSDRAS